MTSTGLLTAAAALTMLLSGPASAGETAARQERLFTWQDPRIQESSGLVDRGGTMVTANDSGDGAVLYVVDGQGRTRRTVDYGVGVRDVEALAPAGRRHVWVGDIGDNARDRAFVEVHRVRVEAGPGPLARSFRLRYPAGASYDAESLVQGPDGRLLLVTKGLTGGRVFQAPARLRDDRVNRVREVARVGELATDAALSRDGRHVLVRGLAGMGVYQLPDWRRVSSVALPRQPQGEAVSVGPGERVRLSSEGAGTAVWQLRLRPAATSSGSPGAASPAAVEVDASLERRRLLGEESGLVLAAGALGVAAVGIGVALRRREPDEV